MSTSTKKIFLKRVKISLGCSSCRKSSLSDVFNPKPRTKITTKYQKHPIAAGRHYYSSSISSLPDTNTTTFSSEMDTQTYYSSDTESDVKNLRPVHGFGRIDGESVAVEKDSDDPYLDFRQSMLQMIMENQIYCKDDLKELLNCFLQLNSPYYHGMIVRAFTEIWNSVFSRKLPASASTSVTGNSYNMYGGGVVW